MEYMFTLSYQLSGDDCNHDEIVERLGAAGCDDALVGIGQAGRIALEFTREADSAATALVGALTDVKRAVPTARLIESAPDFVGLTDVAELVGTSRQNMCKLMESNWTGFPMPVHEGVAGVWHLADLLTWLQAKGSYQIDQSVLEVSKATKQINSAKAAHEVTPEMQRKVHELVASTAQQQGFESGIGLPATVWTDCDGASTSFLMLEAKSFDELHARLPAINVEVPGRANGREKKHTERYSIVRLLGTLPRGSTDFPIRLSKSECPDFIVQFGTRTIGIEHTEAISQNAAKEAHLRAKGHGPEVHFVQRAAINELGKSSKQLVEEIETNLPGKVWAGDSVERDWVDAMVHFFGKKLVTAKRPGFKLFEENWLLVYDNWPAPALQREHALMLLQSKLRANDLWRVFTRVFILDDSVLMEVAPDVASLYHVNHCRP